MTRRFLTSVFVKMNSRQLFFIITQSLVLVTLVWLIGCINNPLIDEHRNDGETNMGKVTGEIVMHKTGGFAGVSQTTSIGEKNSAIRLVFVDQGFNKRKESTVSSEDLNQLWKTLEANDVFTLPTNQRLLANLRDGFSFEITVRRGERYNRFSVYAPDLLDGSGEERYNAVIEAIQNFVIPIQNAGEFIIADMPINDVSERILEAVLR